MLIVEGKTAVKRCVLAERLLFHVGWSGKGTLIKKVVTE